MRYHIIFRQNEDVLFTPTIPHIWSTTTHIKPREEYYHPSNPYDASYLASYFTITNVWDMEGSQITIRGHNNNITYGVRKTKKHGVTKKKRT